MGIEKKFGSINLDEFGAEGIKSYGSHVIEERALPDYRDGLKPVQRRVLWTMLNELNLKHNGAKTKSARVVGDVMGKYHPHGDTAIYDSMVTLVNSSKKLIDGQGNWGKIDKPPAAMRYTECQLSKYSELCLLNKEGLATVKMLPNFTNEYKEPLYLPSLLPNLLLNGSFGIAVGTKTGIPPFKLEGIIKLVRKSLQGDIVTAKDCFKHLEFNFKTNPVYRSSEDELKEYFKTGKGNLRFGCKIKVNPEKRTITLYSLNPYFDLERTYNKLMNLDVVQKFENQNSAGETKFVIFLKQSSGQGIDFKKVVKDINEKILTCSVQLETNITIRKSKKVDDMYESCAIFKRTNIWELINMWSKWRIGLETRMLEYRIKVLTNELEYQKLLAYAVKKIDIIMKILKKKTNNVDEELAKAIKITKEQAKTILDRQTRTLSRLSGEKIEQEILRLKKQIKQTNLLLENPAGSVLDQLKELENII